MLPALGGEGARQPAKGSTIMAKLFGRPGAARDGPEQQDPPAESPRAGGGRAGGLSPPPPAAGEPAGAKGGWAASPRQAAGAVGTVGVVPKPPPPAPGRGEAGSPESPRSRRVLFAAGPSARSLQAAADNAGAGAPRRATLRARARPPAARAPCCALAAAGLTDPRLPRTDAGAGNARVAAMFDHSHALKRSHTTDLAAAAPPSQRSPLPPGGGAGARLAPLAPPPGSVAAIAGAGERSAGAPPAPAAGGGAPTYARSKSAKSITAEEAMNIDVLALDGEDAAQLRKMIKKLQSEAKSLKQEVETKKASLSGSGARASLLVDFAEPRHRQRPSLIAANLEQIRAAVAPGAASDSGAAAMDIDEEDSGFLSDGDDDAHGGGGGGGGGGASGAKAKVPFQPGATTLGDVLASKERQAEEAERRREAKEREAKEREAAAAKAAAAAEAAAKAAKAAPPAPAPGQPKRKYKLLSVYPLLPPNMRREEWSLSQFQIDKKLHAGYASEVYRAVDMQSREALAVKVYNLNALGELNKVQLIREIRLHGAFTHRNIIELYVSFQENHRVVLAQRYAQGGDLLRALHRAGGRLTERSAVTMVVQPLLNCLVYLHAKGITHRDIKPENILFDGAGLLKLADFGLAINTTEEAAVTRAGTLHYMAPEVVRNPLKDHPDDFKARARGARVIKNINSMEVKYPKKMSEECVSFISRALQRHPEDRATTAELLKHPWIGLHMVRRLLARRLLTAALRWPRRARLTAAALRPTDRPLAAPDASSPQQRNSSRNLTLEPQTAVAKVLEFGAPAARPRAAQAPAGKSQMAPF
ncbi:aurka-a [Scenedesmus sp. PABB004]|nr:aurka-a [Scenedesmus sp. PABB004]